VSENGSFSKSALILKALILLGALSPRNDFKEALEQRAKISVGSDLKENLTEKNNLN
jgi:hypothetical protein